MPAEGTKISKNRKRRHGRARTSSQSSVEIQVTETALISPACGSRQSVQPALFTPANPFLDVIKMVGAKGSWTPTGDEVFTIRQLCHYLTEYIKVKELFDPFNPLQVFCKDDPLGLVFGVEKFSKHEALKYVLQQCSQVIPKHKMTPTRDSRLDQRLRPGVFIHNDGFLAPENPSNFTTSPAEVSPHSSLTNKRFKTDPLASNLPPANVQPDSALSDTTRNSPGFPRSLHMGPEAGTSRISPEGHLRRRQSSFSIVYNSDGDGSSPWGFTLELQDSGDESVYSVQSKETVVVHSSTDDYWFLETEDESDDPNQPINQISLQMNEGGISLEFNQADPVFPIEYEVEEQSGGESPPWYDDTDGSESPIEIIPELLVYDGSDEDFWADSESSEFDSGNSSDEELQDGDRWTCSSCDFSNNPLRRYCDRCWGVRSDWLPDKPRESKPQTETKGDFFGLHTSNQEKDNSEHSQGDTTGVKQWSNDCAKEINEVPTLKRTASEETLPASDIDEAALSLYNSALASCDKSQYKLISTIAQPQESYKARIALDFECPPLKKNDSGLGCSLSGIELTASQESASVTSSQESTSSSSIWKASDSAYSSLENLREKVVRSPKTVSLMVPKSTSHTSVVRVVSPLKSPIKILHHTISKNLLSPVRASQLSPLKSPDQILRKMSPIHQLLSPIDCTSPQKPGPSQQTSAQQSQDVCTVCMVKPKEASIIHGKTGHQVCCYVCAKRLRRKGRPCPVCRRPIQKVIKNYIV